MSRASKTCFVIMPFSTSRQPPIKKDQWTEIYEQTFKPAIEDGAYLSI